MTRIYLLGGILATLALAFGMFGWRMHSRGWDAATAHYAEVVNSALAANAKDEAAIASLRAANDQFAEDAAAQAAQIAKAHAEMAEQAKVSASQLAAAQARLREVERENQANRTWAAGRVPVAVANSLRQ